MSDDEGVRIIDISDAEYVPEGVLEGIEQLLNGESATKDEILEALKEGDDARDDDV